MKKYLFLFIICIVCLTGLPVDRIFAWPDFPKIEIPNLNLTLPTSTPTPKIEFIKPQLDIIPNLELATSPTITPAQSPTATPAVTGSITPAVTPLVSEIIESTQSQEAAESQEATQSQSMTTKDMLLFGLIGIILLLLVGQPLWPKIKEWLHKKTE